MANGAEASAASSMESSRGSRMRSMSRSQSLEPLGFHRLQVVLSARPAAMIAKTLSATVLGVEAQPIPANSLWWYPV